MGCKPSKMPSLANQFQQQAYSLCFLLQLHHWNYWRLCSKCDRYHLPDVMLSVIFEILDKMLNFVRYIGGELETKPVCQESSGFWAAERTTSKGRGAKADQCPCLDVAISSHIPKSNPMRCIISKHFPMRLASNIVDQVKSIMTSLIR